MGKPRTVLLNELRNAKVDLAELREAVTEYLNEHDNKLAPDPTMRQILRERMRALVR